MSCSKENNGRQSVFWRVAAIAFALAAMALPGCCGPMGCGPGCNVGGCYDCDGATIDSGRPRNLQDLRRQLICGSGCGEAYIGEWISTPPDCTDPCCGTQFTGGAVKARPFCWERGSLLRLALSPLAGIRYCQGCNEPVGGCGCGFDTGCSSCDSGFVDGGYIDGGYIDGGFVDAGTVSYPGEVINHGQGGGCATCRNASDPRLRMADRQVQQIRGTRVNEAAYQQRQFRQAEAIRSAQIRGHAASEYRLRR